MATATKLIVCPADELPPGARKMIEVNGRSVGVFNVDGTLYAIRNSCPHQGAPLCDGTVGGTMLPSDPQTYVYAEEPLLRCPWHGWQINLATGRPVYNHRPGRARTYPVAVEDGQVVLEA
jgi:3-phenylpropionate/trans-cinnamate dioxygenase ferredoxin subunit